MKRLKTTELLKLSDDDLVTRLNDLRSELSTLRSKASRGTLKKELGEIKTVRRNVARVMTVMNSSRKSDISGSGEDRRKEEEISAKEKSPSLKEKERN